MQKIDRDFRSGVLCSDEIEKWLAGPEPQNTFDKLSEFWGTSIEPPEIVIGPNTDYDYRFPEKVTVNLMQEIRMANVFEKMGCKPPFSSLLKVNLAESMTNYISFHVNPKELQTRDILLEKFQRTDGLNELLDYAALLSKTIGKSFLGRKALATSIPDYAEISNKVCDNTTKKTDKKLENLLLLEEDKKNPSDKTLEVAQYVFLKAATGTGETMIAKKLEKEYDGRMSELIRNGNNAPFRKDFIEYVRVNAPAYGNFINHIINAKLF